MDNTVFLRQLSLIHPRDLDFPIAVIGAGGIGSWTTLALAKMGCRNITVIDFDKVVRHNTPSQIYNMKDKGLFKVDALKNIIEQMTSTQITPVNEKFQEWYSPDKQFKVIISGVDSLEARRMIWEKLSKTAPLNFDVYFDARMAGEFLRVITVSPLSDYSLKTYQKSLDSKVPADPAPCTARSVVYNTFLCGGLLASLVKKYAKKETVKTNINFDIEETQIL